MERLSEVRTALHQGVSCVEKDRTEEADAGPCSGCLRKRGAPRARGLLAVFDKIFLWSDGDKPFGVE